METVTWLKPKLVCEVIYQIVTKDCRLRMPRLHRLRSDKEQVNALLINWKARADVFLPNVLLPQTEKYYETTPVTN